MEGYQSKGYQTGFDVCPVKLIFTVAARNHSDVDHYRQHSLVNRVITLCRANHGELLRRPVSVRAG